MKKAIQYMILITALLITAGCADMENDKPSEESSAKNNNSELNIENVSTDEEQHCNIDGVIGIIKYTTSETIREDLTDCVHGATGYKDLRTRTETTTIGSCTNGEYTYLISEEYGDWSEGRCEPVEEQHCNIDGVIGIIDSYAENIGEEKEQKKCGHGLVGYIDSRYRNKTITTASPCTGCGYNYYDEGYSDWNEWRCEPVETY